MMRAWEMLSIIFIGKEDHLAMGDKSFSLSFSSLLVGVLLLASMASPSHSSNISAAAAAADAAFLPCNHSHGGLTGSCLIADDLGLEYLIDSPHIKRRILADYYSGVTGKTGYANNPAGCNRRTGGQPYLPCPPTQNTGRRNCGVYNRGCQRQRP
ncbi:hypothetical protein NL676_033067 [Syzygium grande]|nr:hypothetical protein NL676_033067 [Syzygium grande]